MLTRNSVAASQGDVSIRTFALACTLLLPSLLTGACDSGTAPTPGAAAASKRTTVASLVPAASDILLGMGAGAHLVAVSNWDPRDTPISGLPRVGDYQSIDWEKLSQLRPAVMVVQYAPDKMPPGLLDRAGRLGIRVVNVKNNHLDDVFLTLRQLGEAIGEPGLAADADKRLRDRLDAVRARVADRPKVRTMISFGADPLMLAGRGNFLDELLTVAGGKNVKTQGNDPYPKIDKEELAVLNPDAVLQLLPQASTQVIESAERFWRGVPDLAAVKSGRIYRLTEPYLLLPGYCVGDIAEAFADKLHPASTPAPSRTTSSAGTATRGAL